MDCSPPEYWQEYWSSELPFPSLGDLHDPGMEPTSPAFPALAGRFFTTKLLVLIVLNLEITLGRTDVFTWKPAFPQDFCQLFYGSG